MGSRINNIDNYAAQSAARAIFIKASGGNGAQFGSIMASEIEHRGQVNVIVSFSMLYVNSKP